MALAVTLLGSATFDTASGTKTVTATPAVGDLIVIVTAHSGNVSSATPTDNNSSGTYTRINSAVKASSADTLGIHVRTALIGAANSTVFTHAPGASSGGGLAVLKITGMQKTGASAARASAKQDNQASGTPTPVLGQAASTVNALIGAMFNGANPATLTPRGTPQWSERADVGYNTPASGLEVMTIDSGETGTSIAWGSSSGTAFASLVMELDSTQALTPGLFTDSDTFPAVTVASVYGLTPGLAGNTTTFFAPTVAAGGATQALTAGLLTNSQSFAAPTVGRGAVALTPALVIDADTFHVATVAPGAVSLTPALFSGSPVFQSGTVAASYALTAGLAVNAASFPAVTIGASKALTASLVANSTTFHSATTGAGSVALTAALLGNTQAFPAATVGRGSVNLTASMASNASAFLNASIVQQGGTQGLVAGVYAGSQTFPGAVIGGINALTPSRLANANAFAAPVVSSAAPLAPTVLANAPLFHAAQIGVGSVGLTPALFANDNEFPAALVEVSAGHDLAPARFVNVVRFPCPWAWRELALPTQSLPLTGMDNPHPLAGVEQTYPLGRAA